MSKVFLFFVLILSVVMNYGVDLPLQSSAIQNAASGLILLVDTPSGSHLNPAYHVSGLETGVTYLFNITDLPYYTLHLARDYGNWGFYLGGNHLRHSLYNESQFNLSWSYHRGVYSIGTALRMNHNRVSDYNNDLSYIIDGGIIINYENIRSGLTIRNISQTRLHGRLLPGVFLWELNYRIGDNNSLSIGIEKERDYDFCWKIGSYYRLHEYIALLCSYQYEPDRIGLGAVLLPSPLKVSYSILTHRYLSPTHFISLTYEI